MSTPNETPTSTTSTSPAADNTAADNPAPNSPQTTNPLLGASNPLVSDLEQEVLDEYARLLGNVNTLSETLETLAGSPSSLTLDGLRHLERKTATVCTLLKASVYSIVLQQQMINESEGQGHQGHQGYDQEQEQTQEFYRGEQGPGFEGTMGIGYGHGDGGFYGGESFL
ncbi:DASH complex subunit DAD3 family protein [Aspergillus homomorphus CBS 101889]|uniref:DASH complex subunit DAD3 n=1 Tax=Aspergillus homomorphus (strain CBS 101889) TaxID=1450537 RepID=A0A395I244_ASPHC|nr:hypothetical protein BO97DRAFT_476804 [Aspergillus homomorphus CBS 101889]RAL14027.1 hypothetical protein BO97DRAFT_476804 [Aspergillus homomorphus CBS 101889]